MFYHAKDIYLKFGISGFFKGVSLSQVGIAPFVGIRMSTYDMLLLNDKVNNSIDKST